MDPVEYDQDPIVEQLKGLFHHIRRRIYDSKSLPLIMSSFLNDLHSRLGGNKRFDKSQQQDADEGYNWMVDTILCGALNKAKSQLMNETSLRNDSTINDNAKTVLNTKKNLNWVDDMFSFLEGKIMSCQECQNTHYIFEALSKLFLLRKNGNVLDSLQKTFLNDEEFVDVDCVTCGKKTTFKQQYCLWSSPDVLYIQLKCFEENEIPVELDLDLDLDKVKVFEIKKDTTKVHFPVELDLDPYIDDTSSYKKSQLHKYDLCSVCYHHGVSGNQGHYTSWCRDNNGIFYVFNDSAPVRESRENESYDNNDAYILFYRRKNVYEGRNT